MAMPTNTVYKLTTTRHANRNEYTKIVAGMPTMLTIENDAITVANIFPRKSAGVWFIKIVIPTAIVVPPTSPAKKRNVEEEENW